MSFPQVGQTLPNGYIVDAAYCIGANGYVLAHKDGAPEPYVVWWVDLNGDTIHGKYFTNPVRAQQHFASCCYDWSAEDCRSEEASAKEDSIAPSWRDTQKMIREAVQVYRESNQFELEEADLSQSEEKPAISQTLDQKDLICLSQHFKAYFDQCIHEEVSNWGKPCEDCPFVADCKGKWGNIERKLHSLTGLKLKRMKRRRSFDTYFI